MHLISHCLRLLPIAVLALALGCMGPRIQPGQPAFVHVAPNGIVSFLGKPTTLHDLPVRLKKAGVKPDTVVKIVPEGDVSMLILKSIANGIGRHGMRRVVIVSDEKETSVMVGGRAVPLTIATNLPAAPASP